MLRAVRAGAALGLVLAASLAAGIAYAQTPVPLAPPPDGKLKALEQALEREEKRKQALERQAEQLRGEAERLRDDSIKVAKSIQEREAVLTRVEASLRELQAEARRKQAALRGREGDVVMLLGALERLSRRPPEALIAQPTAPVDTVRGAMLLRAALPSVQQSADDLRQELEDMAALRREIEAERRRLANATQSMEAERKRLENLAASRRKLVGRTEAERERLDTAVSRMSASAADMRELLRQIEIEREAQRKAEEERRRQEEARRIAEARRAEEEARRLAQLPRPQAKPNAEPNRQVASLPPPRRIAPSVSPSGPPSGQQRSIERAKGSLMLPVQGKVAHAYGERGETGPLRGLRIVARDQSVVIAPFDGQVVYAGRFRGYGQILIIEHGDGYHTLLAGLGRIDSAAGQYVLAGEPVGAMSGEGGGSPELYVELRRNGEPINPLPWLAASGNRTSG